jgi:hypothetical protein
MKSYVLSGSALAVALAMAAPVWAQAIEPVFSWRCAVQHSAIRSTGADRHCSFTLYSPSDVHDEPVTHAIVILIGDHFGTVLNERERR